MAPHTHIHTHADLNKSYRVQSKGKRSNLRDLPDQKEEDNS